MGIPCEYDGLVEFHHFIRYSHETDDAIERVEEWLTDLFETIFFDTLITPESYSAGQEILQRVIEFFRYTKVSHYEICMAFLSGLGTTPYNGRYSIVSYQILGYWIISK